MKILLVVPDTMVGGITTAATNFLNELCKRGHEVSFLDMSGENGNHTSLSCGVDVCKIFGRAKHWNIGNKDVKRAKGIKKLGLIFLGAIKKATIRMGLWYKLIFNKQKQLPEYDLAIAYRQCAPCYNFVLNCVKAPKKICFIHGELRYMGDISSWEKYLKRFYRVCYVSNAIRQQFTTKYPELNKNAAVVYNVVDNDRIITLANINLEQKFDNNKLKLITISRIKNGSKGTERIPEIAKKIYDNGVDFCWYVVGDGPDLENIKEATKAKGLSENVVFVGMKSNPFCYLANVDALVSVSKSEAFGMTILESLICGKPVIAGEYPALKELLLDKENGIISENTTDELSRAIVEFARDTELRIKITEGSQKYRYSKELFFNQFMAAIDD